MHQPQSRALLRRVMGSEIEYGYPVDPDSSRSPAALQFPNHFWCEAFKHFKDAALRNGGRLYADGSHPECCTPEVRSLRDLVRYQWAGHQIVSEAVPPELLNRGDPEIFDENIFPNTRTVDPFSKESFGAHESYQVLKKRSRESIADLTPLLPVHILRQILCGAGGIVDPDKDFAEAFACSPRGLHFMERSCVDTVNFRGILNTRDEPHADHSKYLRYHVITGDGQATQYGSFLAFGIMHLALCLYEDGHFHPDSQLGRLMAYDPSKEAALRDIRSVAERTGRWRVEGMHDPSMRDGVTALRTMVEYARSVYRPPYVTEEMKEVVLLTLDLLDRLEHFTGEVDKDGFSKDDLRSVRAYIPWASKRHYLEGVMRLCADEPEMVTPHGLLSQELQYHNVNPDRSLSYYFTYGEGARGEFRLPALVSEESITRAKDIPPADTRAALRGMVVRAAERKGLNKSYVNWSLVGLPEIDFQAEMPEPGISYKRQQKRLHKLLR